MYAILRGDLDILAGKAASQFGHAFKLLTKYLLETDHERADAYFDDGMGTNVCLKAKNLHHLERAYQEARQAGLPCVLIVDEGHILPPHFDGNSIITAIGIGPCYRDEVNHITKRFSVFK